MNSTEHTHSTHSDSTLPPNADGGDGHWATIALERRRNDLATILAANPELRSNKSLIVDLALDEFSELSAGDASLSPSKYVERFSTLGSSVQSAIYRQLELEEFVAVGEPRNTPRSLPVRLGPFSVVEQLGRGALGTVYLCRQTNLSDRQMVVKTGREILSEARSLSRLAHQNIVPIYSVETDDLTGAQLLCMPFLGRSTLCDVVDVGFREGFPTSGRVILEAATKWQQATDELAPAATARLSLPLNSYFDCITLISARIADGLSHAHRQGVLHGDIKLSNIVISPVGQPLLVDFNLSGNDQLAIPVRGGTLPYMPPEQLRAIGNAGGGSVDYDERSDLYSLGAVIYELLCGKPPYSPDAAPTAPSAASIMLSKQSAGCPPLRCINPLIGKSLAQIVERCLSFDPVDRPESAASLRDQLLHEIRPWARAKRLAAARKRVLGAAAVCALLAGAGVAAIAALRPSREATLLQEGISLLRQGEVKLAELNFRNVLSAHPDNVDARFELARAALASKKLVTAADIFHELATSLPDPRYASYLAYCQSRRGNVSAAIPWYERALAAGDDSGELHNNLSVVYEIGRTRESEEHQARLAAKELTLALERLPNSSTVRLNYIIHATSATNQLGPSGLETAIQFARELCNVYPDCGRFFSLRAYALALASTTAPDHVDEGIQSLQRACQLGAGPSLQRLQKEGVWDPFRLRPEFETAMQIAGKPKQIRGPLPIARFLQPPE